MYGTFSFTQKTLNRSIETLNKIHIFPAEIWVEIMNHYCIDFTIACINKQFYDAFHYILLDHLKKLYYKFDTNNTRYYEGNIRLNFHLLYYNTKLLVLYMKDKPDCVKEVVTAQITNHQHAHKILNSVKNLTLNGEIDESQFIFLSDIYHYDYETILAWRLKGGCCLVAYLPFFITLCPLCCPIWCPYIVYNTVTHFMEVDDTNVYKPLQPFNVLSLDKKRYYDPCDFSKYMHGNICSFDEPKAYNH